MRTRTCLLLILLFLVFGTLAGHAQDTIFRLSPDQVSENGYLRFPPITEWKFQKGNDSAWADPEYDDSAWIRMDSTQVMELWYDEENRFEGWFRFQFQLEPGFEEKPNFLDSYNGAASVVYLDGKRVATFGAIGERPEDYRRNHFNPDFVDLEYGKTYTIAVHFLDEVGSLSQFLNTSLVVLGTGSFLNLLSESKAMKRDVLREKKLVLSQYTLGVTTVLSLFFWFIWALNRKYKHLLLVAIIATVSIGFPLQDLLRYEVYLRGGMWNNSEYGAMNIILGVGSGATLAVLLPWLLAILFRGSIPKWLKISGLVVLLLLAPIIVAFGRSVDWVGNIPIVVIFSGAVLSIYYLVRYRKAIRGALWAIVIGLVLSVFLQSVGTIFLLSDTKPIDPDILIALFLLLIPLSFLVYVALWLRETQISERKKTLEVARVSRENQHILREQNRNLETEVEKRTQELRKSLTDLKATQSQLLHAEKMASLGELTAGIAHEIKNPLNFVNNFSEVSRELLEEMKEELKKGDTGEAAEIATDVIENLEKIVHHGQRADSIVRGMLQHSRSGDGKKEPTDLNALAGEYLRLAYHGLRAKDKSFNATTETDFDPDVGKISVVPQDLGRVILNLLTNAFYAVDQKKKQNKEDYTPVVAIRTKRIEKQVEIQVTDNGNGMTQTVLEKIFQPFFSTKPTGQGTGLGLSMSYDIITKGHGGEIRVRSQEGKGTTFTVVLPAP